MEVEIFTLCDYADTFTGKLIIVGAFDMLYEKTLPTNRPPFFLATRIRFVQADEGNHTFKITMLDPDGKLLMPPIAGNMNDVKVSPDIGSFSLNLVIGIGQFLGKSFGRYSITFAIDDREFRRSPLFVSQDKAK